MIAILLALSNNPAGAQEISCTEPMTSEALEEDLLRLEPGILQGNSLVVAELNALGQRVPCLDGVIDRVLLGRFAHLMSVAFFSAQDEEATLQWFHVAASAAPGLEWPTALRADHPLRDMVAPKSELGGPTDKGLAPPTRGGVFIDGQLALEPRAHVEILHLVQVFDKQGLRVSSYWQEGAAFPDWLLGPTAALQAPEWWAASGKQACLGFDVTGLRALVDQATAAVDEDDIAGHRAAFTEFEEKAPCLDAQVPTDIWANMLALEAIVRYHSHEVWEPLISTAKRIRPGVEVPEVLLSQWKAPPATLGDKLPMDAVIFIDGQLSRRVPDMQGIHVVQRVVAGEWETVFLRDRPPPADWMKSAEGGERREKFDASSFGAAVAGGGYGSSGQTIDQAGNWLGDRTRASAVVDVASFGAQPIVGRVGVAWDVGLPVQLPTPYGEAVAGLSVDFGAVTGFAMGGVSAITVEVGGEARRLWAPHPQLGARWNSERGDFSVGAGWVPWLLTVNVKGGYTIADLGAIGLRVGTDFSTLRTTVEESPPGGRRGTAGRWRAIGQVGVVWGG